MYTRQVTCTRNFSYEPKTGSCYNLVPMMATRSPARLSKSLRCTLPFCRSSCSLRATADKLSLISRTYTSGHGGTPSSLLTSALNQKQATSRLSKEDSVGPFQLGISQATLRRGERAKKWSELSVGGKGKAYSTSLLPADSHMF